jgi:predicted SAM-dependent methyltransferase
MKKHIGKINILALLKKNNLGIKLDVGCGGNKQAGFVGMDIRAIPGVDIVHDIEETPYPLPKECCSVILASHLVEHICPKRFINVMNEWWRLCKPGGQAWIAMPYGTSFGYHQDPTHCNSRNEATWSYFTPFHALYKIYYPKPWKIVKNFWRENGNMEVVLEKMSETEADKCLKP